MLMFKNSIYEAYSKSSAQLHYLYHTDYWMKASLEICHKVNAQTISSLIVDHINIVYAY